LNIFGTHQITMIKKITWALAIVLGVLTIACEKDVLNDTSVVTPPFDSNWSTSDTIRITSKFYIRGKIDSLLMAFQDTVDGYIGVASNATYFECDSGFSQRGQKYTMSSNFLGEIETFEIEFLHCMHDTDSVAYQLMPIRVGAYPFGRFTKDTLNPGVRIRYMDKDSIVYRSEWGSGAPEGAYFYISSVDTVFDADTITGRLDIKGQFELSLHNDIEGSVPIEAGDFSIRIVQPIY